MLAESVVNSRNYITYFLLLFFFETNSVTNQKVTETSHALKLSVSWNFSIIKFCRNPQIV